MSTDTLTDIERVFSSLPRAEREKIILHGVVLRMTDLQKRLFLAESKLRWFSERYHTTLEQLEADGLPDDASIELHEDYILWRHWTTVARQTAQDIAALQAIARLGIAVEAASDGGD
jgi:hypothetical protein